MTARSVAGLTVVEALALLFAVLESISFAATLALLVIDPSVCGLTRIVAVAEAPFARLPKLQVTTLLAESSSPGWAWPSRRSSPLGGCR